MKNRRKLKSKLLIPLTILLVAACFVFPAAAFQVMDEQVTERRVQQVSNVGNGLDISSMSILQKMKLLNDEENDVAGVEVISFGDDVEVSKNAEQAVSDCLTELYRLFPKLEDYIYTWSVGSGLGDIESNATPCMISNTSAGTACCIWSIGLYCENFSCDLMTDDSTGKILALSLDSTDSMEWLYEELWEKRAELSDDNNAEEAETEAMDEGSKSAGSFSEDVETELAGEETEAIAEYDANTAIVGDDNSEVEAYGLVEVKDWENTYWPPVVGLANIFVQYLGVDIDSIVAETDMLEAGAVYGEVFIIFDDFEMEVSIDESWWVWISYIELI